MSRQFRSAHRPESSSCESNLKTGLPAGDSDPKAIMEAFKPTQDPLGAVATDTEGVPQEEFGQAAPQAAFPAPGQIPDNRPQDRSRRLATTGL